MTRGVLNLDNIACAVPGPAVRAVALAYGHLVRVPMCPLPDDVDADVDQLGGFLCGEQGFQVHEASRWGPTTSRTQG